MADLVIKDSIGYKRRNPWGVFLLSVVTLGVYYYVWWYKINNELNNYGIENNPTTALLAVLLGPLIIVHVIIGTFSVVYYQSELNKPWDAEAAAGAEVRPA